MPCVILLLTTQHSRLIDSAQGLARTAAAARDSWPGELYDFRQNLVRHDRMERDVLHRLGASVPDAEIGTEFDMVLAAQAGLDAVAVATAARQIAKVIDDHAFVQECELFPALTQRYSISVRRQLGERYARAAAGAEDKTAALAASVPASNAWPRSARMSSTFSIPTDSRT